MGFRANLATATAVAAATIAWSSPALAATTVADWGMDSPSGATTMYDSSGYGNNGKIGSLVKPNISVGTEKGYDFTASGGSDVGDKALVVVPTHSSLNPNSRNTRITVQIRTWDTYANLLQKGQAGAASGNQRYKVEISGGKPQCQFLGNVRERTARWGTSIADGKVHTITCEKHSGRVNLYVDGVHRATAWDGVGSIWNNEPVTLGGKRQCGTNCDYYTGWMGKASIQYF